MADVNGDGKADLAAADNDADHVSVTFGNGDGTFQVAKFVPTPPPVPPPTPEPAMFLLTADINGYVDILLGNGNASFQTPISMFIAAGMRSAGPVAVGDLNHDGKPDLVVVGGDADTGVLIGNGDGTFQPVVAYRPSVPSVAVGDFNGDGIPDIIGVNGDLALWIGVGDGTFGFAKLILTGNSNLRFLAVGDFNHDGKLDVVLAGTDGNVSILLGNGDGTFHQSASYTLPSAASGVTVGDFNRDGNLDVVVTISNTVAVLLVSRL